MKLRTFTSNRVTIIDALVRGIMLYISYFTPHERAAKSIGFSEILLSIGVLCLLGIMALTNNVQTLIQTRRATEKIFKVEGFYNGEFSAWHNYERDQRGLALQGAPDSKQRHVASFEGSYDLNLSETLIQSAYDPSSYESGTTLNVKATMEFDSGRSVIHHLHSEILRIKARDLSGSYCGSSVFARKGSEYRTCLWADPGIAPPPVSGTSNRLAVGNNFVCFIRKNGSVSCWGTNLYKILSNPSPNVYSLSYVPVPNLGVPKGATRISVAFSAACVYADGRVKCWGGNHGRILSYENDSFATSIPLIIEGLSEKVADISVGVSMVVMGGSLPKSKNWACAVDEGSVKCWGSERYYSAKGVWGAGDEDPKDVLTPIPVPDLPHGATAVSIQNIHACAVIRGAVWCWGYPLDGSSHTAIEGVDSVDTAYSSEDLKPDPISGVSSGVTQLCVGSDFGCALQNGKVKCWGGNTFGQLGVDPKKLSKSLEAVLVEGISNATLLSCGGDGACAVMNDELYCWGGHQVTYRSPHVPTKIPDLPAGIIEVRGGGRAGCALVSNEKIYCWGLANYAAGAGSDAAGQYPVGKAIQTRSVEETEIYKEALPDGKDFKDLKAAAQIAAGGTSTCTILNDKTLRCWGKIFTATSHWTRIPSKIEGLTDVTGVAPSDSHICTISDGRVYCWGRLWGTDPPASTQTPTAVQNISSATVVSTGSNHACTIENGATKCWGENQFGQLGNNTKTKSASPVPVEGLHSGVSSLCTGKDFSCAVQNGAAKCWGYNGFWGQLGNNSTTESLVPVPVEGLSSGVTAISCGSSHACAIQNGAAKCWGNNQAGQLGDNSYLTSLVPVQVEALTSNVTSIATGGGHSCALIFGKVKCWGSPILGQLALNDWLGFSIDGRFPSVPIEVAYLPPNAQAISTGVNHSCTLIDGKIYCWGDDTDGCTGNRIAANPQVPILVPILE